MSKCLIANYLYQVGVAIIYDDLLTLDKKTTQTSCFWAITAMRIASD